MNLKYQIENFIYLIRGQKVLLDQDLALLYATETKALIQAVKRNIQRFPNDFCFQLSNEEYSNLRSQIVTSSWGGRRTPPYAFTEQGVAMLSSVLKSQTAIHVNIQIIRTFVRIRQILTGNDQLSQKIKELELKYDGQFQIIFKALNEIISPKIPSKKRQIGFSNSK